MLHVVSSPTGHTGSVSEPPSGKDRGDTNSGRVVVGPPLHHHQKLTDFLGQSDFCIMHCASHPSAHKGITDSSDECVQTPGRYEQTGSTPFGSQSQPGVLAVPATNASPPQVPGGRCYNGDRCIGQGMGGQSSLPLPADSGRWRRNITTSVIWRCWQYS